MKQKSRKIYILSESTPMDLSYLKKMGIVLTPQSEDEQNKRVFNFTEYRLAPSKSWYAYATHQIQVETPVNFEKLMISAELKGIKSKEIYTGENSFRFEDVVPFDMTDKKFKDMVSLGIHKKVNSEIFDKIYNSTTK